MADIQITEATEVQSITPVELNRRYSWSVSVDGDGLDGNLATGEGKTEHLHRDTIRNAFNGHGKNVHVDLNGSAVIVRGLGKETVNQLTAGKDAPIIISTPKSYFSDREKVKKQFGENGITQ